MSFFKYVLVLVSGSAIGHGITAAALPLLSRLYTPDAFGVLAVFSGFIATISVAACLRFDLAIALPRHQEEAANVLILAVFATFFVAGALSVVEYFFGFEIAALTNQPTIVTYLWLVPLGVLLAGVSSALQQWFIRQKDFNLIAKNRVAQSSGAVGTQLSMGYLGMTPLGLLVGNVINSGAACLWLGYKFWKQSENRRLVLNTSEKSLRATFIKFKQYPQLSTLEALFNSASLQVPIIIIAALSISSEAGFLMLAMTAMQVPMALFGNAVSQVYVSHAAEKHRDGQLRQFTLETLEKLSWAGIGPLIAVGIVAPKVFPWLFGSEWGRSGILVSWMIPWFITQLLVSPISLSLHILAKQTTALQLQFIGFAYRILCIYLAAKIGWGLSETYALSNFFFYLVYLFIVLALLKTRYVSILGILQKSFKPVLIWTLSAVLFRLFLLNR